MFSIDDSSNIVTVIDGRFEIPPHHVLWVNYFDGLYVYKQNGIVQKFKFSDYWKAQLKVKENDKIEWFIKGDTLYLKRV